MVTPDASEAWLQPIYDAVVADVAQSGYFDSVNAAEPKHLPGGKGLTASVWVQGIAPIGELSGLDCTAARVTFIVRMFANMVTYAPDMLDPTLLRATSNLIRRYHGDFDFGGIIRNVDLLGAFGIKLESISGYYAQDNTTWRVVDITVPCVVVDVWPQVTSP